VELCPNFPNIVRDVDENNEPDGASDPTMKSLGTLPADAKREKVISTMLGWDSVNPGGKIFQVK
jgi:hypothetical protein